MKQKWAHCLILLALVMVESCINAGIFAKGLSSGIMGGITTAICVAIINIFMSFSIFAIALGGNKVLCPKGNSYRIFGAIVCLVWVVAELCFSYGVAHYREALEELARQLNNPEVELTIDAAKLAAKNYFSLLTDLMSWGLWLLTVIFGLVAFLDGIFWQEPFPNYSSKWDMVERLRNDYDSLYGEALRELNSIKNAQIENIKKSIQEIKIKYATFAGAVALKSAADTQFQNAFLGTRTAYQTLIKQYQNDNVRYRTPESRNKLPAYFEKNVDLKDSLIWGNNKKLPDFETKKDQARLLAQQAITKKVQDQLLDLVKRVQSISDDVIRNYNVVSVSQKLTCNGGSADACNLVRKHVVETAMEDIQ